MKITLDSIVSGFKSVTKLISNFDKIEDDLNNKVLYRDNPEGEPNYMQNDLDMNSYNIINQGNPIEVSGFNWTGDWSSLTTYAVGDAVHSNGTAYIAIAASTNQTPPNGTYWQIVAEANYPTQTGNADKALTTDGSAAIWGSIHADHVDFTNSGTGGVERTLQAKLEDVVNVKDFGAVGDGVTDDTAAIQAAIDSAAALNNGGSVFLPTGVYLVSSSLTWKPKVSFELDKGAIIRASASLSAAIIEVPNGASNRISRVSLRGGQLDCAFNAAHALRLRDFQQIDISDFDIVRCDFEAIYIGDAGQSASCYELNVRNGFIRRNDVSNPITSESPYGIYSDTSANFSDSFFESVVIIGYKYGVRGKFFNCDFAKVHPWSNVTADGIMDQGFWIVGDNNTLVQCYADNWQTYGFRFDGVRNVLNACRTLRGTDFTDNTGTAVYLDSGAELNAKNNILRAFAVTNRIGAEFSGDLSGLVAEDNYTQYVVTVIGNRGSGKVIASAAFTTNAGLDPTIEKEYQATVTRNDTGDYTLTFANTLPDDDYTWVASSSNSGIAVKRAQSQSTTILRVQFYNQAAAGTLVDPDKCRISVIGQ